jgi:hypothetical protein
MSTAVLVTAALGAGLSLGSVLGYVAGRRSSREELAAAQMAWAVQNNAPDRDDLALPPERTGEHPVALYDWEYEDDPDPISLPRTVPPTYRERLS